MISALQCGAVRSVHKPHHVRQLPASFPPYCSPKDPTCSLSHSYRYRFYTSLGSFTVFLFPKRLFQFLQHHCTAENVNSANISPITQMQHYIRSCKTRRQLSERMCCLLILIRTTNVMQLVAFVFITLCGSTVHVSGALCTHHQECI